MFVRLSVAIFATTTFLTPLHVSLAQAQESSTKSCSLVTELNGAEEVVWSENADIASLVVDAKTLEISPADYKALCAGEEIVQEAVSEDATEEDATEGEQESTEVASEDVDVEAETKESIMSSAGTLAPLAGLGLAGGGGGGGGGGSSSVSYDRTGSALSDSTSFSYNSSLDSTWTARQEYKNVRYYDYPADGFTPDPGSRGYIHPYTLVGVNNAFARGLSGSGKTIAIVDSDFYSSIHGEIKDKNTAGNVSTYGTLSYDSYSSSDCLPANGGCFHGVHVAGIAAADYNGNSATSVPDDTGYTWSSTSYPLLNYGMVGVAYNSALHLSDYTKTSGGSQASYWALATDSARLAGAVAQNNSWGYNANLNYTIDTFLNYQSNNGSTDGDTYAAVGGDSSASWDAYATALNNFQSGGVVVRSSGNDTSDTEVDGLAGMPLVYTDLAEAWLTVGNLVVDGGDATSSTVTRLGNQCGLAAKFCIFADGYKITSGIGHNNGSMYYSYSGSSMSAPIVSGGVALLSEAFPNHTPEQIVDRILATADNTFFTTTDTLTFANGITHGYNSEYGQGILDLEKALSPITSSMVSNAILVSDGVSGTISSARRFEVDRSQVQLGAAFGDSIQNSLNGRKAYFYDALNGGFAFDMGSLVKSQPITASKRHSFDNLLGGSTIIKHRRENGFSFISDKSQGDDVERSMMAFLPVSPTTSSFVGKNIHIQNAMSFTQRGVNSDYGVNSASPFNIPFIQASEQGTSAGKKWGIGDGILSFGLFEGDEVNYGLNTTGFVADYGREIGSTHTSVFFGETTEEDGFLATSVEGAFAEKSKANTTFAGISSYGWLNSDWSFNAFGSVGSTTLDVKGVGLLNDIKDVTSTSFAFEVARSVGLNEQDSVHIGISQPLRVENGNATISIPQLYETNGNLSFNNVDADLSPSGRQLDLNLGYQASLNNLFNAGIQMAFSQDYGHIKSDEIIQSAAAFVKFDF